MKAILNMLMAIMLWKESPSGCAFLLISVSWSCWYCL